MTNLIPIEHKSQRVLTTKQIAEFYETDTVRIQQNYIKCKSLPTDSPFAVLRLPPSWGGYKGLKQSYHR